MTDIDNIKHNINRDNDIIDSNKLSEKLSYFEEAYNKFDQTNKQLYYVSKISHHNN